MSGSRTEIARAQAQATIAREQLVRTAARLKNRLNPAVRARETWADVRETGETLADDAIELAYDRPQMVAGVAGAIALFLLRRPLARLVRPLFRRGPPKWDVVEDRSNHPARLSAAGREGVRR